MYSSGCPNRLYRNGLGNQRGTMNSRSFRALSLGVVLIAGAASAGAQVKKSEETGDALRFESSWGNVSIIRGADGPVVGTLGWFRDFDLTQLVASSPPAVADAREFQTNNFRGSLVGTIGATTTLVGVIVAANSSNNAASPVLVIGGVGAIVWGAQHLSMSYSALSRALWWYNRDLKR